MMILSYVGIIPVPSGETAAISYFVFACFLVSILIILLGLYTWFKESLIRTKILKRYRERDPAICTRVIKDGPSGAEYLISGSQKETFGNACREQWQFIKTDKKSNWIVKDERGNDITNDPLESYDSIATIMGTYDSELLAGEAEGDLPSKYTSIENGTEYFDD